MTAPGDEPVGWDPTRPLADGPGRRRPARDPAPEGDGGDDGDAAPSPDGAGAGTPPSRDASRRPEGDAAAGSGAPGGEARGEGGARGRGAGASPGSPVDDGPPVLLPHLERLAALATRASGLEEGAARYAGWAVETLRSGGKLLLCGNGGSAATAEHVAAEYLVRFDRRRRALPAVALTGSGAVTSAAANDFSWEEVFERPLRALAEPGDLVVLHSTTGESENVLRAARAASAAGLRTVALLAAGGGRVAAEVDLALVVPTDEPARAQELHLAIEHAVVDRVDAAFAGEEP